MTVAELVATLQQMPHDAECVLRYESGFDSVAQRVRGVAFQPYWYKDATRDLWFDRKPVFETGNGDSLVVIG